MTGARPDTWMPLYWGDYRRDTAHLSAAEHGAYLLLIGHYWTSGKALPDDDRQLARISSMSPAEWRKARPTIAAFFQIGDGAWRHGRIDAELARCQHIYTERSKAGSEGARKRWQRDGKAMANGMANASENDASHSHNHKEVNELISLAARGTSEPRRQLEPGERKAVWASRIMDHLRRTLPTKAAETIIADYLAGGEDGRREFERADANLKARRAAH